METPSLIPKLLSPATPHAMANVKSDPNITNADADADAAAAAQSLYADLTAPAKSLMRLALASLARREHSRLEIAQKLQRRVATVEPGELAQVLDRLQARGLLCDQRFAANWARARAGRYGRRRIEQELRWRGIDRETIAACCAAEFATPPAARCAIASAAAPATLSAAAASAQSTRATESDSTEFAAALALWQRRFGHMADSPRDRARQGRFLAARGFASAIIARILRVGEDA